jgi:F-type H+-transporting ATPase subunit b
VLEFHLGTILFQLVVFLVLMIIVTKIAIGPVTDIMKKRQDHIDQQLNEAEQSQKEARELLAKQQEELKKTREEAHLIIENEKKRAEAQAQEIINQAKARADRMIEEAKLEINNEKAKAIASLRDEVAELSMLLASKVLEREVKKADHEKELDAFIKQVGDRL